MRRFAVIAVLGCLLSGCGVSAQAVKEEANVTKETKLP